MTLFPPPEGLIREAAWVARCVGRAESAPLRDEDLAALASYMVRRELANGTVLFRAGDRPQGVWILRAGGAELAVGSGRGRAVVQLLWPGDVEGDLALILDMPPPYTARAVRDTVCLFVPNASFERLLLDHPAVGRRWLTSCALRLARSQQRVMELLGRSLPQQVARLLLDETVDDEVLLPQRTLSAMLGVHRPSLNKVLRRLAEDGVVSLGYAEVRIRDRGKLEAMAGRRLLRPDRPIRSAASS